MKEAFPLTWPQGWKRVARRTRSRFEVSGFGRARDFLLAEVKRMGGSGVILSTNIPLRPDGLPYANSREPNDPGVAVYFRYGKREMCFACDAFVSVRENAYSIGKTIEALRGIERWGASDMMERAFRGFAALAATSQEDWSGISWNAFLPLTSTRSTRSIGYGRVRRILTSPAARMRQCRG